MSKFLSIEDLPTDASQIGTDAEAFFDDEMEQAEAVLVLAQLDPVETVADSDGTRHARWSPPQQAVIIKAKDLLEDWKS